MWAVICREFAMLRSVVGPVCCVMLVSMVGGCGGSKPAPTEPTTGQTANRQPAAAGAETPANGESSESSGSKLVSTDAQGRKWVDGIPYDVFFGDPLAVAANNTPVGVPAGSGTGAMAVASATPAAEPSAPQAAAPAAAAGGAADWKSLITMEQVTNEAKRVRNHLSASLQSQGTYNGNYAELQVDGAVVAALALIVAEHPEDVSWKKNAKFLRDYGTTLRESSKSLGRESFQASQAAAESIEAVLNGNLPADAKDAADAKAYVDAASRAGLMKRIEKAFEWMRANVNTDSVFQKELEQIQQEAAVLAALAKMIADESYDSADEDDYAGYAKDLLDGARAVGESAVGKDYSQFGEGMNKIQKACNECHLNYGNG